MRPSLTITIMSVMIFNGCSGVVIGDPNTTFNIDPSFTSAERAAIYRAVREWHDATGGEVNFSLVAEPGPIAQHRFRIVKRKDFITQCFHKDGKFSGCMIATDDAEIDLVEANKLAFKEKSLECIALHELGHYMGLVHSDNPQDIMYPIAEQRIKELGNCLLSQNDLKQFYTGR